MTAQYANIHPIWPFLFFSVLSPGFFFDSTIRRFAARQHPSAEKGFFNYFIINE
jgi:hypothetical protein